MDEEKRLYRRVDVECQAQGAYLESASEHFSARVVSLGPEGVRFMTDEALDANRSVTLDIDIGGGYTVKLIVKVTWSEAIEGPNRFQVGAKIIDAQSEDLKQFIQFYCTRLLASKGKKKKILIVEDEKNMANLLQLELIKRGYDAVCAYDGESGFFKYMTEHPDLIVLDVMLPKLNGYEICRKIRCEQDDSTTPVLILSAIDEDEDKIVGGIVGAQKYITKPFDANHLLTEIEELLKKSDTSHS